MRQVEAEPAPSSETKAALPRGLQGEKSAVAGPAEGLRRAWCITRRQHEAEKAAGALIQAVGGTIDERAQRSITHPRSQRTHELRVAL